MRAPVLRTFVIVLVLYALLGILQPGWLSPRTPVHLLNGGAVLGLAALGQTFVVATGGIDLAVGAVVACSSIAAATAITAGMPAALALAMAAVLGALFGAFAGLVIWLRGLPPFLVTLAMMLGLRGLAAMIHEGSLGIRAPDHEWFQGLCIPLASGLGGGLELGPSACLWLLATLAGTLFLARMRSGRDLLAHGGDWRAARLLGVPAGRTLILAYTLSGFCAALGGVAATLDTSAGNPNAAIALELDAIAAVVIGGAALQGGIASPLGTLLGVILLGMIQMAITFDGRLGAGWSRIAVGALLRAFLCGQAFLRGLGVPARPRRSCAANHCWLRRRRSEADQAEV